MSKRRALMMALRRVVGGARKPSVNAGEAATKLRAGAAAREMPGPNPYGDELAAASRPDAMRSRANAVAPRRTNASPISVVDNEFDAPARRVKPWRRTDDATGRLSSTDEAVSRLEGASSINGMDKAAFIDRVRRTHDLYDQSDAFVLNWAGKNGMIRSAQ